MRKSWTIPLFLLVAGTASTVAVGAAGDDNIRPQSLRLQAAGDAALAKAQHTAAIDAYEAAAVVDPRNGRAFIGIAHAYEAQGLPGKAVRFYREALALDPNDLSALEGQGKALVARGARARANLNLVRIRTLCKSDCAAAKRLEVALAAPVVAPIASAEVAKPAVTKN
jgi:Tfp pilus assembly protein PilF